MSAILILIALVILASIAATPTRNEVREKLKLGESDKLTDNRILNNAAVAKSIVKAWADTHGLDLAKQPKEIQAALVAGAVAWWQSQTAVSGSTVVDRETIPFLCYKGHNNGKRLTDVALKGVGALMADVAASVKALQETVDAWKAATPEVQRRQVSVKIAQMARDAGLNDNPVRRDALKAVVDALIAETK